MAGRLYSPLIFLSALFFSRLNLRKINAVVALTAVIAVIGATQYASWVYTTIANDGYRIPRGRGYVTDHIADEWLVYAKTNLLLGFSDYYKRHIFYVNALRYKDYAVVNLHNIGFSRLAVDETTHIMDAIAISDPLLARLPALYSKNWRIGHLWRTIPSGYLETIETGENIIEDSNLHEYYDILHVITSEPIFSVKRFKYIINMNLGRYDYLIDEHYYRYKTNPSAKHPCSPIRVGCRRPR